MVVEEQTRPTKTQPTVTKAATQEESESQKHVARSYEVIFTVPAGCKAGDRLTCALPTGAMAMGLVPPAHEPGDRFATVYPPLPGPMKKDRDTAAKHFKCAFCGRRFASDLHLRIHSNAHNRLAPAKRQQLLPHPSRIRVAFVAGDQKNGPPQRNKTNNEHQAAKTGRLNNNNMHLLGPEDDGSSHQYNDHQKMRTALLPRESNKRHSNNQEDY